MGRYFSKQFFCSFFLFIIISLILLHTYLFSFFIHITLPMVNAHWFKIMRNRNSIYLNMANKKKNLFLFSYGGTFFSLYRAWNMLLLNIFLATIFLARTFSLWIQNNFSINLEHFFFIWPIDYECERLFLFSEKQHFFSFVRKMFFDKVESTHI